MKHEWILDVLADLRDFSAQNGLDALAEQLVETHLLATMELAAQDARSQSA